MLYTVVPLERIYSCRTQSILGNSTNKAEINASNKENEYKNISLPYGLVSARRDGDNYIVEGIHSTDMSDYLNTKYSPGAIIDISGTSGE